VAPPLPARERAVNAGLTGPLTCSPSAREGEGAGGEVSSRDFLYFFEDL